MAFLLLAAALGIATKGSAAAPPARVQVFFLQGEQLVPVIRPGATAADAVRRLIAGPTRAERRRSLRSYVHRATSVHNVTVTNGLATVDLDRRFVAGHDPRSLLARLSQLVRTLTGVQGATEVQLLIDGAPAPDAFPGVPTSGPITFRFLQTPNTPLPKHPQPRLARPTARVKQAQQRLIELGYLLRGADDGRFGPVTQEGILAFQKWERLDRSASLDSATEKRLTTAVRPTPITRRGGGKRAEILLDRQVALLIRADQVVRAIAVSSGKASTPTPPGSYHVYAKIALVVSSLPGVAPLGPPVRRRDRVPRVRVRSRLSSVARMRAPAAFRSALDVRLRHGRHARQRDRALLAVDSRTANRRLWLYYASQGR
jgi:peptidoglycan hydrolase-like protein with peptidoglycan-binding domain